LGGALGDRYDQRRVIAGGLAGAAVLAVLLFNVTVSPLAVYAAAFGLGAMLSGFAFVNLYALAQKSVPNHMTGRVSGVFVFTYYSFVAVSGYMIGLLVELGGWDLSLWVQMVLIPVVGAVAIFAARTSTSQVERAQHP
jgi:MFS family permease